jgi:dolichol-phosphate mannosyltransferase
LIEVSIVLPTFCEAGHIVDLVAALRAAVPAAEVIVVDDRSPDGTAEKVSARFGGDERVRLIVRDRAPGLARSVRAGIDAARGARVVVMDSDFNHDPRDVPRLLAQLDAGALDLVVGSRFVDGGGMDDARRFVASALYSAWLRALLGTGVKENLSGFFAARAAALRALDGDAIFFGYGDYFFRLLHAAARRRWRVDEIPVVYGARRSGASKTRLVRTLFRYTAAALGQRLRVQTK